VCGFLFIFDEQDISQKRAIRALKFLEKRGPNSCQWENYTIEDGPILQTKRPGQIFMGHTRLSILETSADNNQPFRASSGSLIFNGEIYNYKELKKSALLRQNKFRFENSDTEVLAAGLSTHGVSFLPKINGMFAGAFLDFKRKNLTCFRDYFGQKPIFYYLDNERLLISSEIKAILDYVPGTLDIPKLLQGAIAGYNASNSVYCDIKALHPGQHFSFDLLNRKLRFREYWPEVLARSPTNSRLNSDSEFEEAMTNSMERHMRSDVPIGLYLSGGVDSSLLAKHLAKRSESIKCFSISFDDPLLDESPYAQKVAGKYGFDLVSETVSTPPLAEIDKILDYFDEPFYDSSAVPTYYLNRLAADHNVCVALGGEGADELFMGYKRYIYTYLLQNLKKGVVGFAALKLIPALRRLGAPLRHKYLQNMESHYAEYLFRRSSDLGIQKYFVDAEQYKYTFENELTRYSSSFPNKHELSAYLAGDRQNYLSSDILTKSDRAGMMNGVEVRAPFLDLEIARFASSVAPEKIVKGKQGKFLLKAALSKDMGRNFAFRVKQGFTFPLRSVIAQNYPNMRDLVSAFVPQIGLDPVSFQSADVETMNQAALRHFWKMYVIARFLSQA